MNTLDTYIRDSTFEEHQKLVTACVRRNLTLILALQLEIEDVVQELSIRLFRAIERFDSERSCPLPKFLYHELQHEMLNIRRRHKPHGLIGAPMGERVNTVYLDQPREDGTFYELPTVEDFNGVFVEEMLTSLPQDECSVFIRKMNGEPIRKKVEKQQLANARNMLAGYFIERNYEYA